VDSKAECGQLNLAHKTKTNKCQCPLSSVQRSMKAVRRNQKDYGRKDL